MKVAVGDASLPDLLIYEAFYVVTQQHLNSYAKHGRQQRRRGERGRHRGQEAQQKREGARVARGDVGSSGEAQLVARGRQRLGEG